MMDWFDKESVDWLIGPPQLDWLDRGSVYWLIGFAHHHFRRSIEFHSTGTERYHAVDQGDVLILQPLQVPHEICFTVVLLEDRLLQKRRAASSGMSTAHQIRARQRLHNHVNFLRSMQSSSPVVQQSLHRSTKVENVQQIFQITLCDGLVQRHAHIAVVKVAEIDLFLRTSLLNWGEKLEKMNFFLMSDANISGGI